VVNNGTLVVRNASSPVSLSRIGGSGSLVQSGTATTTLTGSAVTYTGRTTVTKGTLALRDGATLAHSTAIRLTSTGARLDPGPAGLRVVTTLSGKGAVKGAVTNDGVVAGGVTVAGDYTQSAKGELVLAQRPLKVSGSVRLTGDLDLSAAGTAPSRKITVLNNTGKAKTTGAFKGLKEGARLKLADTTYRISYQAGDGNDVVLTATTATPARSANHPDTTSDAPTTAATLHTTNTASSRLGWWPYLLAVGLLIGLAIPAVRHGGRRGGGGGGGGRHAAPHQ
jgi:autotransporter-associated beta strand protein